MIHFGILSPETVGVCGQSTVESELAPRWVGQIDRQTAARFHFQHFKSQEALEHAFLAGQLQAMLVDRNRGMTLPPALQATTRSVAMNERWIGMLVLNGGSPLFCDAGMRRDFGWMTQTLARALFPTRATNWADAPTFFTPRFLPDGVLPDACYQRALPALTPETFAAAWRAQLAAHPLRILYTPARGALTAMLDSLIAALQAQQVPLQVILTESSVQVYEMVDTGDFDVVPRGWGEDEDDPDGFIGAFEKQAPACAAQQAYNTFQQAIAGLSDRNDPQRAERYSAALRELEDAWLFVPFCQDRTRLLLAKD